MANQSVKKDIGDLTGVSEGGLAEPLVRQSLSDQIARRLADMMIDSDLRPGDLLPATGDLAGTFGVSLPVVREALKSLEGEGLIRLVKGKGSIVRPVDREFLDRYFARALRFESGSVVELLAVRRALECEGAALAAVHGTDEQIAGLRKVVEAMAGATADPDQYAELDVAFHLALAEATHNEMLFMLIGSVRSAMKESVLAGLRQRETAPLMAEVQRLHEAIVDAVESRDPEVAGRSMQEHFDSAANAIISGSER